MREKKKTFKKNPLTRAQNRLLKESLRNLLGTTLVEKEKSDNNEALRNFLLRSALNGRSLE